MGLAFVASHAIQFVDEGIPLGEILEQTKVCALGGTNGQTNRERGGEKPLPAPVAHNFLIRTLRKETGSL